MDADVLHDCKNHDRQRWMILKTLIDGTELQDKKY